jgi:hypothetical protein
MHRLSLLVAILLSSCHRDHTPPSVQRLADQHLASMRDSLKRIQAECTGKGPRYAMTDWGALSTDGEVLNAKVGCKVIPGLELTSQLPAMRPEPPGDKSGASYPIGVSKGKTLATDPFPLETARVPSWLTTEPGAIDLCVASGQPDAKDFAELCVAFKAPAAN